MHYILTRAAYSSDFPLEANRRRLELTRGITARSFRGSTEKPSWLVLMDKTDPLYGEREAVLRSSGLPLILGEAGSMLKRGMADAPEGPWEKYIRWGEESVVTTRIDDDDAFTRWAFERIHDAARAHENRPRHDRVVLTLETGFRVTDGLINPEVRGYNQFASLYAPAGDRVTVMDLRHPSLSLLAPEKRICNRPAWLWVRHSLARSDGSPATVGVTGDETRPRRYVKSEFDVDWDLVLSLRRGEPRPDAQAEAEAEAAAHRAEMEASLLVRVERDLTSPDPGGLKLPGAPGYRERGRRLPR